MKFIIRCYLFIFLAVVFYTIWLAMVQDFMWQPFSAIKKLPRDLFRYNTVMQSSTLDVIESTFSLNEVDRADLPNKNGLMKDNHTDDHGNQITDDIKQEAKTSLSSEKETDLNAIMAMQLPLDKGPGADGKPVYFSKSSLSVAAQSKFDALYQERGYNAYVSDFVQLNRKVKDPRPQRCKDLRYPTNLPAISVVIPFRDETLSVLLRTVYSVYGNTPDNLLKEIILVDDGSINEDTKDLKNFLEKEVTFHKKTSVIKMNPSVGLMMARQAGIEKSSSEFFAVLDSHIEVAEGWLEPLLARLLENPKALLCSRMGVINKDTFAVHWVDSEGPTYFPFFTWNLDQQWLHYRTDFKLTIKNLTIPFPFPTVQGMMIVMKKSWFMQLGGFDPGMKIWGSEQFELSAKVWMCGGVVELVPCSYAAHLYRKVVWKLYNHEGDINKLRFAEVWMDDYKNYVYTYKHIKGINAGNMEERKKIRQQNNCSSFQTFLEEMQKIGYIYDPSKALHRGKLCNKQFKECLHYVDSEKLLTVKNPLSAQSFELSNDLQLHRFMDSRCLVYNSKGSFVLQILGPQDAVTKSKWNYKELHDGESDIILDDGTFVNLFQKDEAMVHIPTGKCLTVLEDHRVSLEDCKFIDSQFWVWE